MSGKSSKVMAHVGMSCVMEIEIFAMLDAYIEAAVQRSECEFLDGDGVFYCIVPGLQGVWTAGPSIDDCVRELREGLVSWIQLGIEMGHPIPVLDGLELTAASVG